MLKKWRGEELQLHTLETSGLSICLRTTFFWHQNKSCALVLEVYTVSKCLKMVSTNCVSRPDGPSCIWEQATGWKNEGLGGNREGTLGRIGRINKSVDRAKTDRTPSWQTDPIPTVDRLTWGRRDWLTAQRGAILQHVRVGRRTSWIFADRCRKGGKSIKISNAAALSTLKCRFMGKEVGEILRALFQDCYLTMVC